MGIRALLRSGRTPVEAPVAAPEGTLMGTDGGFRAVVDDRGGVRPAGVGHGVGWWIGAEDRWHDPATEPAVRQVRPGPAPVVETRMRVPGGDIVATSWAAVGRGPAGAALIVELANETPAPVAVAVTVSGDVRTMSVDGRRLIVGGSPAVVLDRDPGRFALVDASTDLWGEVTAGRAVTDAPGPVRCRAGGAAGALVVPLNHRGSMRFAVPADNLTGNPAEVFPAAGSVAAGWSRRLDGAASVALPDEVLTAMVPRRLVDLLLAPPTPANAIELARWGLAREAGEQVRGGDRRDPAGWLDAAAALWLLHRDATLFTDPLSARPAGDVIDDLVRAAPDTARSRSSIAALAPLFAALGDDRAAADAAALGPASRVVALPEASEGLAARLATPGDGTLALLTDVPPTWFGQDIEVHGLATTFGRIGYAVRWHGARPALLWELDRHGDSPVRITAPGLDPAFVSTDAAGEGLLEAPG